MEERSYLGWRRAAVAEPPEPLQPEEGRASIVAGGGEADVAQEAKEMMDGVLKTLGEGVFLEDGPPIPYLMQPDADWSGFGPFILARLRAINALGGPRMRVVWSGTVAELGRLPQWPEDSEHILDLENVITEWIEHMDDRGKVDGRCLCVSIFSHRWSRPSLDPAEAHPDTVDNVKAAALAKYGERGTCPIFHPHHIFDYFYWIDCAGIDQADRRNKWLGIAKLPAYVATCIEMIFFHTPEYEARAWTRVERCIGYVYCQAPLFVFIDKDYANATEALAIDDLVASNEVFSKHLETGGMLFEIKDPLAEDAGITDPADRKLITDLLDTLMKATPLCPAMKMAMAAAWAGDGADPAAKAEAFLKFGSTFMPVDTEHWKVDSEKNKALLGLKQAALLNEEKEMNGD